MTPTPQLLRLLQLASPALPVGAFAYSQGLEWSAENGLHTETLAADWICGILKNTLARLDVPVLARLHEAWELGHAAGVQKWSGFLYASRESMELRAEEHATGSALARLLTDLDMPEAREWGVHPRRTFATLFALAGARWGISHGDLCAAYCWAWAENQVAAAIKLVPLGQTAGQRILSQVVSLTPDAVSLGLALEDDAIGASAPGQAMASALHETQRTRLFRS